MGEYPRWSQRLDAVIKFVMFLSALGFIAYFAAYWAAERWLP